MTYSLELSDRERLERDLTPPLSWRAVQADSELLRYWRPLHERPDQVLLHSASGAVVRLTRVGDKITATQVIEGAEARKLLAQHSLRPSAETSARVSRLLRRGEPFEAAVNAAFPRRLGVSELSVRGRGGARQLRVGNEGVLLISTDTQDKIVSVAWLVGAEAMDAIEAHEAEARWTAPPFPQQDLPARTPAEAALFVQIQRGEILDQRRVGPTLQVLASTPEGRRLFTFTTAQPLDLGPTDLGFGRSRCLDPVELLLFASTTLEEQLAHPERGDAARLRLAAAAAAQAARFVEPGAAAPAADTLRSAVSRHLLQRQPERLRPDALDALARRLNQLADGLSPAAAPEILRARNLREARWALRAQGVSPELILQRGDEWRVPRAEGGDRRITVVIDASAPAPLDAAALLGLCRSILRGAPSPHPLLGDALAEHAAGELDEALACLHAAKANGGPRAEHDTLEQTILTDLRALRAVPPTPHAKAPGEAPLSPAQLRAVRVAVRPGRGVAEALAELQDTLGVKVTPLLTLGLADERQHQLSALDGDGHALLSMVLDGAGRVLGRALLVGVPARAQQGLLQAATDAQAGVADAMAAIQAITQALTPVLLAAGAGDAEALRSLLPRPGDAARAFLPDAAPRVQAAMERWLASDDPPRVQAGAGRTALRVHPATVEALATRHPLASPFPGAYEALAQHHLTPGRTWVCWVFHAPGHTEGIRYDGLVWLDDHWAWFPKPWRGLK